MKQEERKRLKDNWEGEFNLVKKNPIYFIEMYWNKLYPDEKVELSDEEKQRFYGKYKPIPVFNDDNFFKYIEYVKRMKDQGYKDWEIFI